MPSTSAVTRKTLTSAQKLEVILAVDNRGNQTLSQIASTYGIHRSTLSKIIQNKDSIISDNNENITDRKRKRKSDFPEVDLALYEWLQDKRSQRIPISGPILKAKAELFARNFHYNDWKCNDGWLQRWKDRYGISARVLSGEANHVNLSIVENRLDQIAKMQELLSQLCPEEVIDVNDYVLIDNTVVTNDAATDEKITGEIQEGENEEVLAVDDGDPPEHISVESALAAHDILNKFFVQEGYVSDEITVIGTALKKIRTEKKTNQTHINDFLVN